MIKNKFLFDISSTFIVKVIVMVLGFISTIFLARLLGSEGMGEIALFTTISMLGMQFGNLGLHATNLLNASKNINNISWLFGNSVLFSIVMSFFIIILLYVIYVIYPEVIPLENNVFYLSLIWIPMGLIYLLLQNILIGINKIQINNTIDILMAAIKLCFILFFYFLFSVKIFEIALIYTFLSFLSSLILFLFIRFILKVKMFISLDKFKNSFNYGLKSYLGSLLMFLIIKIDIIMISSLSNLSDVGIYSIALYIINLIMVLPNTINTIIFPKIVKEQNFEKKWKLAIRVFFYQYLIILVPIIIFLFFSGFFIEIFFGAEFLRAIEVLDILLLATLIQIFNMYFGNFISTINIPRSGIIIGIVVLLINIYLNYILIPIYGFIGAAYATLVSYLIFIPYYLYYLYKIVIIKNYNIIW